MRISWVLHVDFRVMKVKALPTAIRKRARKTSPEEAIQFHEFLPLMSRICHVAVNVWMDLHLVRNGCNVAIEQGIQALFQFHKLHTIPGSTNAGHGVIVDIVLEPVRIKFQMMYCRDV